MDRDPPAGERALERPEPLERASEGGGRERRPGANAAGETERVVARPERRLLRALDAVAAAGASERPLDLVLHPGGKPLEPDPDRQVPTRPERRERGRLDRDLAQRRDRLLHVRRREPLEDRGGGRLRQRVEAEHHLGDEAERAERAAEEARQVEPRHVLHHLAAAAGDDAVRAHHRDPDDEIPHRAVARPPRPEGVRGDDPPHRGALGERRIDGEPLPVRRQPALQLRERHPRLHRDDLVGRGVLADPVEPPRVHDGVEPGGRRAELEIRPAADEGHGEAIHRERAHRLGRLVEGVGLDREARANPEDDVVRLHRPRSRAHAALRPCRRGRVTSAPRDPPPPRGGGGRGPASRRRAGAWGRPCRGS